MFDVERAERQAARLAHHAEHGFPLDRVGRQATMLAVLGVMSVEDAAATVGLKPQDLVREAEAWAFNQQT